MKKYLTIMLAALMFCAMSFTVANNAWAENNPAGTNAGLNQAEVNNRTAGKDNAGAAQSSNSYNSTGQSFGGNIGLDFSHFQGHGVIGNLLGSIKGSGGYNNSGVTQSYNNASSMITTPTSGATPGATSVGGGTGGGFNMPSMSWSGVPRVFSTAINKLLNLFGNVKLLLYVLAAFGLVGFAFMAIFGKVRWGWVCALAFGLAAVAAAGQVIDYVTQAGIGGAMVDTLGTNGADW